MSVVGETASIFGILKSAYDLVQGLRKSNDVDALKAGISELADRLLSARAEEFKVLEDFKALRERAEVAEARLKAALEFAVKEDNYDRRRLYPGAFVYRERVPRADELDPPNYCASCFGRKELSILQPMKGFGGPVILHVCPSCKIEIAFRPDR